MPSQNRFFKNSVNQPSLRPMRKITVPVVTSAVALLTAVVQVMDSPEFVAFLDAVGAPLWAAPASAVGVPLLAGFIGYMVPERRAA